MATLFANCHVFFLAFLFPHPTGLLCSFGGEVLPLLASIAPYRQPHIIFHYRLFLLHVLSPPCGLHWLLTLFLPPFNVALLAQVYYVCWFSSSFRHTSRKLEELAALLSLLTFPAKPIRTISFFVQDSNSIFVVAEIIFLTCNVTATCACVVACLHPRQFHFEFCGVFDDS